MCRVRRTPRAVRRAASVAAAPRLLLGLALIAGCGRSHPRASGPLTFEELPDSATLTRGEPLLSSLSASRLPGGAMRVMGALRLPDGARVQITVSEALTERTVKAMQVTVDHGAFETPPFMAASGPLPKGRYRFDVLAYFNRAWQTDQVLNETSDGRALRGQGLVPTPAGVVLHVTEERSL